MPTSPTACRPAHPSAVRGRVRSLPARAQLCPPGVVTAASPGLAQSLRASPQLCSPQGPPQPCRAGTGPISRCGKRGVTWQWHRALWKVKPGPQAHAHPPGLCFIMRPLALSWGQGPENGVPCAHSSLKVILSRKQRARGSPVGRPSHTHGWHVPLPAHSPQRPIPSYPRGQGTPATSRVQTRLYERLPLTGKTWASCVGPPPTGSGRAFPH